ncbi:MAG: RDD family protein [Halobacteriales archaeon]
MFDHPDGAMNTERDVIGERVLAILIDLPIVFTFFTIGQLLYLGNPQIPSVVSLASSLFWFLFSVFGLMPFFLFRSGDPLLLFLAAAGLWAVYSAVLEWLFGQTVGKRLIGLVVVTKDGERPSPIAILLRNALRAIDALVFYVIGFLVILFTDRKQRVGDLVAGTIVVATGEN